MAAQKPSRVRRFLAGVGFVTASYGTAALGALTMRGRGRPDGRWFRGLKKPAFQPPNRAFGPVWTVLYATLAYSGWRVWKAPDSPERSRALALWATQLGLNGAWTPLFFGARRPDLALADIGGLDVAAGAYAAAAAKVDRRAAAVVAPYLGWIAFATTLNTAIVAKNR